MINKNKKLIAYVRYDGLGNPIPSTLIFRTTRPRDGKYIPIQPQTLCCNGIGDSYIIFQNSSANVTITSITSADGAINSTETLLNSNIRVFRIPFGYDETITMTLSTPGADIDINNDVTVGTSTIEVTPIFIASGTVNPTVTIATGASPLCQYLINITDD